MSQSKSVRATSFIPLGLVVSGSLIAVSGLLWGLSLISPLASFSDKCNIRLGAAFVSKSFREPDVRIQPIVEASVLLDTAPLFVPGLWNVAGSMPRQSLNNLVRHQLYSVNTLQKYNSMQSFCRYPVVSCWGLRMQFYNLFAQGFFP